MHRPLQILALLLVLALPASAQTFSTGDYQINRKKATAGFEVAELLAGSNITLTWNNTNKTLTLASAPTITLTGDVTGTGTGSFATTIANQAVTPTKLAATLDLSAKTITLPALVTADNATDYFQINDDTATAMVQLGRDGISNGTIGLWDSVNGFLVYAAAVSGGWSLDGQLTAHSFIGNGSLITNLNANFIATGTLPLARGGLAVSLTDPNADRLLFWDDSAGQITWLPIAQEPIRTVSTSTTATLNDKTILVNAAASSITITLPAVASSNELRLNIKALTTNGGANTITIDPNGTETIDGSAASLTTTTAYTSWQLHCNGSAWYLIK